MRLNSGSGGAVILLLSTSFITFCDSYRTDYVPNERVFSPLRVAPTYKWCEHGLHGALRKTVSLFVKDSYGSALQSADEVVGGDDLSDYEDDTQYLSSDTVNVISNTMETVLRSLNLVDAETHSSPQSMFALFRSLKRVLTIFRRAKHSKLTKMEAFCSSICRVSDLDFDSSIGSSAVGCFAQNLGVSLSACSTSLRDNLPDFTDCKSKPKSVKLFAEEIPGFPMKADCYTHDGSVFKFSDPNLTMPINLINQTYVDSIPASVRDYERISYLTLWRASVIFYRSLNGDCTPHFRHTHSFSESANVTRPLVPVPEFIPGWKSVSGISLTEVNGPHSLLFPEVVESPVIQVLKRADGRKPCKVIILTRGTLTDYEWYTDFNYFAQPKSDSNRIHGGAASILSGVFEPLFHQIKEALAGCSCSESEVVFTGHSLGGAITIILSTEFKHRLDDAQCAATVYSVAFSSPRVQAQYHPNVRYRSIIDKKDVLHSFPCFHGEFEGTIEGNSLVGWPRCGPGHAVSSGVGVDNFPTPWGRVVLNVNRPKRESQLEADRRAFDSTQRYLGLEEIGDTSQNPRVRSEKAKPQSLLLNLLPSELRDFAGNSSSIFNDAVETLSLHLDIADLLKLIPTRGEIIAGHASYLSCGLSSACRASERSKFTWRCDELPLL